MTDPWLVTEPGIWPDMPAAIYHADPVFGGSLSSSGARMLLPPSCPAAYAYGAKAPTKSMEKGTAAHTQVLGAGQPLHVVAAADWRTKAAREEADDARRAGLIPVLAGQAEKIRGMVAALARHHSAAQLFAPGSGLAEQSMFWWDEVSGIWRRARLDWLPHGANGMCIIPDYKTCASADEASMSRALARYGYHQQADWYGAAVQALRPGTDVRFVLVCQETEPPYLVACYYLEGRTMEEARHKNRRAMEIYRDCTESGIWPGYDPYDGISPLGLPGWAYTSEDY
jgi:hypothetical protein